MNNTRRTIVVADKVSDDVMQFVILPAEDAIDSVIVRYVAGVKVPYAMRRFRPAKACGVGRALYTDR